MILAFLFFGLAIYGICLRGKDKRNPYIQKHETKLKNDDNYSNYLYWCSVNGEIPMEKEIFLKDVESKENEIKKLFN